MLGKFRQSFVFNRIITLAMPIAIWLIILFLVQQSAAQSPLNVWRSSGPNADIRTVVFDPFNPNIIYAGSFSGVFKSVNNGTSWFPVNLGAAWDLSVDYVNPNTIYAGNTNGVFKSTDGGLNWNNLNAPYSAVWIQVSQSNPNLIAAANYENNVSVTSNGGVTWEASLFSVPIPNAFPIATEFDPQNPHIIYTYVDNYDDIALYKSTDGGASWVQFNYGNVTAYTSAFKVNSNNPNIVYASTYLGLYKSTNGGATWTRRGNPGNAETLAIDPLNPDTLYAGGVINISGGGYRGIYKSIDDGATWSAFNNGLTNLQVQDLAFDRSGKFLHAATTSGVFSVRVREDSNINSQADFDFDGDGRSDISVFRPSDGIWYLNQSTNGFSAAQFGLSTDKLTPTDFDGDGKTDISVYRDGIWYWLNSSNNSFNARQFGLADDVPAPSDFSGDGRAELAVYRNGNWFTLNLSNNQFNSVQFGISMDKPVVGDYDGDNRADYAVYRNGTWYLLQSTEGFAAFQFGLPTDKLVPADYDGDGKTDIAVYRDGTWYVLQSGQGFTAFQFGNATDIPAPADYDGDGRADAAVYRDGIWYLRQSTNGFAAQQFGVATDKPVPTAFLP